jgi:hypothetical protein
VTIQMYAGHCTGTGHTITHGTGIVVATPIRLTSTHGVRTGTHTGANQTVGNPHSPTFWVKIQ